MTTHAWIPTANGTLALPTDHALTPAAQLLVSSATSGGRIALVTTVEVPGAEPPCHRHVAADTLLYVIAGEVTLYLDGDWIALPVGRVGWVPRGTEYTFVVGSVPATLLTLFLPGGFEHFYTELGPTPWRDVERAIGTAARYGCEITGPHPHT